LEGAGVNGRAWLAIAAAVVICLAAFWFGS
jgi:hypothetical protein